MLYIKKYDTYEDYEADLEEMIKPNVSLVGRDLYYNPYIPPPPLYIEALEDGMTVTATITGLEYSLDNKVWTSLAANSASPSVATGERVYLRVSQAPASGGIKTLSASKRCNVGGNIMSLVYGGDYADKTEFPATNIGSYYSYFSALFQGAKIVSAKSLELPAKNLSFYEYIYAYMFKNCSSLVEAPDLPAEELGVTAYYSMFENCTVLETTPAIYARSVKRESMSNMFLGCSGLKEAGDLLITMTADSCCKQMFRNCSALVKAPALPATSMASECYRSMFQGCSSLTEAPVLPAEKLVSGCYSYMFGQCSALSKITAMTKDALSSTYANYWVSGVAATGIFVKNAAATWANTFGTSAIPSGWTVETAEA